MSCFFHQPHQSTPMDETLSEYEDRIRPIKVALGMIPGADLTDDEKSGLRPTLYGRPSFGQGLDRSLETAIDVKLIPTMTMRAKDEDLKKKRFQSGSSGIARTL